MSAPALIQPPQAFKEPPPKKMEDIRTRGRSRTTSTRPVHKSMTGTVVSDKTLHKRLGYVKQYKVGNMLGKGGFAYCYEMTSVQSNITYAGKVIPKKSLKRASHKKKLLNEIKIHKSLSHPNVVKFQRFFEDDHNVYILLELCPNQTLMEMVRRRGRLTETEVQYYIWQLVNVCDHLHKHNVIHRDLKLSNLFLYGNMEIKLGDFGLATRLEHPEERKRTICGTPNYIAPEILDTKGKNGHSFEVDVWSIGVIMYTMLVGKPPFETRDIKTTYKRIQNNVWDFPSSINISPVAKSLVRRVLHTNPGMRPTLEVIKCDPFFQMTPFPKELPQSVLTTRPRFRPEDLTPSKCENVRESIARSQREAEEAAAKAKAKAAGANTETSEALHGDKENFQPSNSQSESEASLLQNVLTSLKKLNPVGSDDATPTAFRRSQSDQPTMIAKHSRSPSLSEYARPVGAKAVGRRGLRALETSDTDYINAQAKPAVAQRLAHVKHRSYSISKGCEIRKSVCKLKKLVNVFLGNEVESTAEQKQREALAVNSSIWVTKWVDYSNKYGVGYSLSQGATGVYFNDASKVIVHANKTDVRYIPRESHLEETTCTRSAYPAELEKKMRLVNAFITYLDEHKSKHHPLPELVARDSPTAQGENRSQVYVQKYFRTKHAILFYMNTQTIQVNFNDQTEVIVHLGGIVSYTNKERKKIDYELGPMLALPRELRDRMQYVTDMLSHMINKFAS